MDIPVDRRLFLLNRKLITWQNTVVDAGDDVALAQHIGNVQMGEQATARAKQAMKAIRWLEERITELEKASKGGE